MAVGQVRGESGGLLGQQMGGNVGDAGELRGEGVAADGRPGRWIGDRDLPLRLSGRFIRYWARPDIAYPPVTDLEPLPYAPVWRREAESEPIRALAGIIRDLGPLPSTSPGS
ncbi:hypothetical protein [Streptomyces sp. CA-132043]|uniref:hypothetical protein n=1 Tax=Streptomyces sp. CA-132043 TaxID=3240048 RepID=UPI003D8BBE73